MRMQLPEGMTSFSIGGDTYEPDADGCIDLPEDPSLVPTCVEFGLTSPAAAPATKKKGGAS